MKYPLKGFMPDLPPMTPGILVTCTNAYPSETGGLRATPTPAAVTNALASACQSSFSFQDEGLSYRHIAATATKLYELDGTDWDDVSGTTSYANVERWRYAAWGNWLIATDINTAVQVQKVSLDPFEDLAGSPPKAKLITSVKLFLILAGHYTNGARVQWSAQGDAEDWTPSLTTQAGYTDLIDTPGPITALSRLGDGFVVFKERTLYLAYYAGTPYVWNFLRIPAFSGCISPDAIMELEGMIYYPGIDDFYVFDGTYPKRIGQGVREWFFNTVNRTYLSNMRVTYDCLRRLIFWWYPLSTGGDAIQECLIFDINTQRWGRMVLAIEEVLNLWRAGITYDTIPNWFPTYNDITSSGLTYGSPFWSASTFNMGVFTPDHKLCVMTGTPGTANLITHDLGDQTKYSRIHRAWPYFSVEPTTCSAKARGKTKLGGTATEGGSNNLKSDGGIDLDLSAKYLSLDLTMTGDFDISGFDADVNPVAVN